MFYCKSRNTRNKQNLISESEPRKAKLHFLKKVCFDTAKPVKHYGYITVEVKHGFINLDH